VTEPDVAAVFRAEYGRSVATLTRFLGDIDLAEEAVQEAFAVAVGRWPAAGFPPNPGGWITTTARNKAIDRLRHESARDGKHAEAVRIGASPSTGSSARIDTELIDPGEIERVEEDAVPDDRLRLIFTCCHPALAREAQIALTLRLLCGLTTPEIARAFLVPEPTMGQRISRAKKKIKAARIPYRVPAEHELPERLPPVLAAVYLTFTAGYTATSGPDLVRADLCEEAVRLARLLVDLMPDEPEAAGLLALLLLTHARRRARSDPEGAPVLLTDQDRSLWDAAAIAEGHALVRRCLRRNAPGPYQLQAAINAVHTDAARAADTDWRQILALYDQLLALTPTPVVALNRAVALAEVAGPEAGLEAADAALASGQALGRWHLFHATRAELLTRLGRDAESREALRCAVALATNDAERRLLDRRLLDRRLSDSA